MANEDNFNGKAKFYNSRPLYPQECIDYLVEKFNLRVDSVIADIEYSSKTIDNTGNDTTFTVKVPLSELENDRPKSIYIKLDFSVGGNPETLKAGFDLSW